jgi:hypothetical protein
VLAVVGDDALEQGPRISIGGLDEQSDAPARKAQGARLWPAGVWQAWGLFLQLREERKISVRVAVAAGIVKNSL